MTLEGLLETLRAVGVELAVVDGELRYKGARNNDLPGTQCEGIRWDGKSQHRQPGQRCAPLQHGGLEQCVARDDRRASCLSAHCCSFFLSATRYSSTAGSPDVHWRHDALPIGFAFGMHGHILLSLASWRSPSTPSVPACYPACRYMARFEHEQPRN
jgi:hypothetical protein